MCTWTWMCVIMYLFICTCGYASIMKAHNVFALFYAGKLSCSAGETDQWINDWPQLRLSGNVISGVHLETSRQRQRVSSSPSVLQIVFSTFSFSFTQKSWWAHPGLRLFTFHPLVQKTACRWDTLCVSGTFLDTTERFSFLDRVS